MYLITSYFSKLILLLTIMTWEGIIFFEVHFHDSISVIYSNIVWGIVKIDSVVESCWQLNLLPFHFSEFNLTSDTETFGHLISSNSCIYISVC